MKGSPVERFWAYTHVADGCWLWTGGKFKRDGYGQLNIRNGGPPKPTRAHRFSYELHYGPIPPGLWVLHRCDNRICVRPDHLFLGTNADNVRDMVQKGRHRGAIPLKVCVRGHVLDGPDKLVRAGKQRPRCKQCSRIRKREFLARRAAWFLCRQGAA